MKVFGVEYDFNLITVQGNVKPPEHRVHLFSDVVPFLEEIRRLQKVKAEWFPDHKCITNMKVYMGEIQEQSLDLLNNLL